jgi:hypothetical protein
MKRNRYSLIATNLLSFLLSTQQENHPFVAKILSENNTYKSNRYTHRHQICYLFFSLNKKAQNNLTVISKHLKIILTFSFDISNYSFAPAIEEASSWSDF